MLIPNESIARDSDGVFVFLVANEQVSRRRITTGERLGRRTQVVSGLQSGDRVVADLSADTLTDLADGDFVISELGRH